MRLTNRGQIVVSIAGVFGILMLMGLAGWIEGLG
jgi:hypothetical protein